MAAAAAVAVARLRDAVMGVLEMMLRTLGPGFAIFIPTVGMIPKFDDPSVVMKGTNAVD